jgi:hypothetical protein
MPWTQDQQIFIARDQEIGLACQGQRTELVILHVAAGRLDTRGVNILDRKEMAVATNQGDEVSARGPVKVSVERQSTACRACRVPQSREWSADLARWYAGDISSSIREAMILALDSIASMFCCRGTTPTFDRPASQSQRLIPGHWLIQLRCHPTRRLRRFPAVERF